MSERLLDFLYVMLRDHVHPGDVENMMINNVRSAPSDYTNPYLEQYARNLAWRLTDDDAPICEWPANYVGPNGEKNG